MGESVVEQVKENIYLSLIHIYYITMSNNDDGIAHVVEKFMLH